MEKKGQGALEYLLLIGGAIIVAAIVIGVMMSTAQQPGACNEARACCVTNNGACLGAGSTVGDCQTADCTTLLQNCDPATACSASTT